MRAPPLYIAAEVFYQFSGVSEKLSPSSSLSSLLPHFPPVSYFRLMDAQTSQEIVLYQSAVRMLMSCCRTIKLRCEAAGGFEVVQKYWKSDS